jgi:SAM-dependent methyltransferase
MEASRDNRRDVHDEPLSESAAAIQAAFGGHQSSAARWFASQPGWWHDHYVVATETIQSFLAGDGLSLEGRKVLDLGCGDGIISLGMLRQLRPSSVLGVDLVPVDPPFLNRMAAENGVAPIQASEPIRFEQTHERRLPIEDRSIDVVVAWSVFEHVADIDSLFQEIERVLRPGGFVFIIIWPLWYSQHGGHLWPWFGSPFPHLEMTELALNNHLAHTTGSEELAQSMFDLYRSCNRVTVDDLQTAIVDAGLYLAKVELQTGAFHVSPALQRVPISRLAISGVKLLVTTQKT